MFLTWCLISLSVFLDFLDIFVLKVFFLFHSSMLPSFDLYTGTKVPTCDVNTFNLIKKKYPNRTKLIGRPFFTRG